MKNNLIQKSKSTTALLTLLAASSLLFAEQSFAEKSTPTPVPTGVITPCDDGDPLCGGGGGNDPTPTPCPFLTATAVSTAEARPGSFVEGESGIALKDDPCGGGGGGGTATPNPTPTDSGGSGTATPSPTPTDIGGTVIPTPTDDGGGTATPSPTPTDNGGGGTATPSPTPTDDGNGGTATPSPTPTDNGGGGSGTATPTPTSNGGGGNGTPTPTPTVGGFDNEDETSDVYVPVGCSVEVPYYKLKSLLTTLDNYFGRRGDKRVRMVQAHRIKITSAKSAQSKFKKEFGKRNGELKNVIGAARAALITVPGVMVQCSQPPASCVKADHFGINIFEDKLKVVEDSIQSNYKHALKGIEKKSATALLMRREGAVKYFPRIAAKTEAASLALSAKISRSSYICQRP